MKILFATTNPSKIKLYKNDLESHGIELLTLNDIDVKLDFEETGSNAIENAIIKAENYFKATNIPTIGMDDNLFIENIPENKQPGTHVRRVNGKELNDEEMIDYYTNLVKEYGDKLTAKWVYGMALATEKQTFTYSWSKEDFYLVSTPCNKRDPRYPLNSISIYPEINKYFAEVTDEEKKLLNKKDSKDDVITFLLNSLNIN